jgi:hypothetical protein
MGNAVLAFPANAVPQDEPPLTFAQRVALVRPPCFWPALPGKPLPSPAERVGLVRLALSIPGEADDEQLVAFIEAMRHAPAGDIVEIGSGGGRTAALLAWLARRYQIGPVLCRDDWDGAALVDFEIAVAPVAEGRLNYLQGCDTAGYGPGFAATTATFGETRYLGRIALLHLANGDADLADWLPRMAPGGWIVADHDTGFADALRERACACFTAGGARFVQLKR